VVPHVCYELHVGCHLQYIEKLIRFGSPKNRSVVEASEVDDKIKKKMKFGF